MPTPASIVAAGAYNAGLGTNIEQQPTPLGSASRQKLLGSVAGDGIKCHIADCYEFIVNHNEEGDRIFLSQLRLQPRRLDEPRHTGSRRAQRRCPTLMECMSKGNF